MESIKNKSDQTTYINTFINIETRDDLKNFLKTTTTETTSIKFGATWCKPCHMIAPTIHSLNEEVKKAQINMNYIDLDVDQCSDLYAFLRTKKMVRGIPIIMCYKKSQYNDNTFYVPTDSVTGASITDVVNFYKRNIS